GVSNTVFCQFWILFSFSSTSAWYRGGSPPGTSHVSPSILKGTTTVLNSAGGVRNHSEPHAAHVILQGGVEGVERPQSNVCVSWEEQRSSGGQRVDGATRGDPDGDPARHTHHTQVLAAVDVNAGFGQSLFEDLRHQNHLTAGGAVWVFLAILALFMDPSTKEHTQKTKTHAVIPKGLRASLFCRQRSSFCRGKQRLAEQNPAWVCSGGLVSSRWTGCTALPGPAEPSRRRARLRRASREIWRYRIYSNLSQVTLHKGQVGLIVPVLQNQKETRKSVTKQGIPTLGPLQPLLWNVAYEEVEGLKVEPGQVFMELQLSTGNVPPHGPAHGGEAAVTRS
ncbi:hypothetical protein F7725_002485, partial [Dissostichus mawsoni]